MSRILTFFLPNRNNCRINSGVIAMARKLPMARGIFNVKPQINFKSWL